MVFNNWHDKRIWRITKTYPLTQPILAVIQLILWVVIAIGNYVWFDLAVETFGLPILVAVLIFYPMGWRLDRRRFFLKHKARESNVQFPDIYYHQAKLNAALTVRHLKISIEDFDKLADKPRVGLGMKPTQS